VTARIAVLDYGMSNLRSAVKAFELLGAEVTVAQSADDAAGVDAVVLPGVGAFGEAMRRISAQGLDRLVVDTARAGRPILGICLGMQLLLDGSDENPGVTGLGLVPGRAVRLETARKVPQIGWNTVTWSASAGPLASETTDARDATFYFVHSFAARPESLHDVAGTGDYGAPFCAAIAHENVSGVQFHPEKSSRAGLALLGRWLAAVAAGAAVAA
jgi:imidazole glycerol-phosphate synthase subunit HisH